MAGRTAERRISLLPVFLSPICLSARWAQAQRSIDFGPDAAKVSSGNGVCPPALRGTAFWLMTPTGRNVV